MSYLRTRGFGAALSTTIGSSAGAALLTAAPFTGPAAPFVALAGVISDMLASFGLGAGCGQSCVLSSEFANQAAAQLNQNLALYFGIPAPRPQSAQAAALANVQTVFAWVQQQCGNPQLGQAGKNCISQRLDPSACQWKALPPQYPGEPAAGACWNWVNAYQYPIQNDLDVVPDSQLATPAASASQTVGAASSVAGAGLPSWVVPAAIGGAVLLAAMEVM